MNLAGITLEVHTLHFNSGFFYENIKTDVPYRSSRSILAGEFVEICPARCSRSFLAGAFVEIMVLY